MEVSLPSARRHISLVLENAISTLKINGVVQMMKPRKGNNRGLLRQVLRVRQLSERYGLPLLFDVAQLEMFTDGELRAYFYNLSDDIKHQVLDQNPAIAQRWKFYDNMPVWEFIERVDQLRANRQGRNSFAREDSNRKQRRSKVCRATKWPKLSSAPSSAIKVRVSSWAIQ
jgi:hypothetical protein